MHSILVIDDNRVNVALYQRVIEEIPATAVCFTDPRHALRAAAEVLPSLVVVDYRMPQLDGVEFIRKFRQIRGAETVPVIMLTSVSSPVLWQMALDAGADHYLMKPIDKAQFTSCVKQMLGQNPRLTQSKDATTG